MNGKLLISTIFGIAVLVANPVLAQTTESAGLLRDAAGKTLYTFDKDGPGESRCLDGCAVAWPPFMAGDAAKATARLTLLARPGGGRQWAIDGKPLYYFAGDMKPGESQGDGVGGVWHVVRPVALNAAKTDAKPGSSTN
jgi:predicted lipoprotein with Yx(FWY)xxD motif